VKYFFDNCISYRYARMLAALEEWEVVALRDQYPEDIGDVDLFGKLRGSGFVFITGDRKQRSRQREAAAIKEAGITSLWLGPFWSKKTFMEQAKWIINRWERIDQFAQSVVVGTCAEITEQGKARPFSI
jgi:hypothetical protein